MYEVTQRGGEMADVLMGGKWEEKKVKIRRKRKEEEKCM